MFPMHLISSTMMSGCRNLYRLNNEEEKDVQKEDCLYNPTNEEKQKDCLEKLRKSVSYLFE